MTLQEVRSELRALLGVEPRLLERAQFQKAERPVRIKRMVVGVEVDGLSIKLGGISKTFFGEQCIAFDALLLLRLGEFDARRRRALLRGEEARLEALLRVRDLLDDGKVVVVFLLVGTRVLIRTVALVRHVLDDDGVVVRGVFIDHGRVGDDVVVLRVRDGHLLDEDALVVARRGGDLLDEDAGVVRVAVVFHALALLSSSDAHANYCCVMSTS